MTPQDEQDRQRKRRAEIDRTVRNLRPIDNELMKVMFEDWELVEYVLRIVTGKPNLTVIDVRPQKETEVLTGVRGVRYDIHVVDVDGRRYNIEVEKSKDGAHPLRIRYNGDMMDVDFLKKGQDFTELPISVIIFISETDVIGDGRLCHWFCTCEAETGIALHDRRYTAIINASFSGVPQKGEETLAKLAHDFLMSSASDMALRPMRDRMKTLKETKEGRTKLSDTVQELVDRVAKEEHAHGRNEMLINFIRNLMADNIPFDGMVRLTGETPEKVRQVVEQITAEMQPA